MARILSLPVAGLIGDEDVEIVSFDRMLAEAFDRGERLYRTQASAVGAYEQVKGGFFPVGVGWGKTGICLMIAELAWRAGLRKIVMLLPPNLVPGLIKRHVPEWRRRVAFSVPMHFIAGRGATARQAIAASGVNGLYVFPYSLLSATDAMQLLEGIGAQLYIADEVHKLRNPHSARTKRVLHFLDQPPVPQFVGMSGTVTDKKLGDYKHLIDRALRDGSPLPRSGQMAFLWDQAVNADARSPATLTRRVMAPLLNWARTNFPAEKFNADQTESYRRAFRRRLTTAPGVVATGDEEIGVSLCIENQEPERTAGYDELIELMRKVAKDFETPQGEPIDHAIHCWKWLYELTTGLYLALVWQTPEELAKARKIELGRAAEMLALARQHLGKLQAYHKLLREFFKSSPPGLDTPREVGRAISRGDRLPTELCEAWHAVKDADFEGRPERYSKPVRVCDYKMQHAVKWAREAKSGILWVYHQEVGNWLVEVLDAAGLNPLHCPAGADDLIEEVGDPGREGKGDRLVVASLSAHGTGRNLQAFERQLYVQWPRSAALAEQSLGRTHRNGQMAEELIVHTCFLPDFDHVNRAACLNDGIYVQQSLGQRQKIVTCDYYPMPMVFSPEFLREQGANPQMLSPDQRKMLMERFDYQPDGV